MSDVTERRPAEDALRESEARLAAAFESVPAGVAVVDLEGGVVIANGEYRKYVPGGITPSRDTGRGSRWRAWDEQGRRLEPGEWPDARALRGEVVVPGQEMLFADDEGREAWANVATAPTRDEAGRVTGCISVISDITGRKRAEAALRESGRLNALLVRFSDEARGLSDPALVAKAACGVLAGQLGTELTIWAGIDWGSREYVAEWAFSADGAGSEPSRWPLDPSEPYAAEHLAGRPVVYDDAETDPRIPDPTRSAMAGRGIRSGIAVPVVVDRRLRAVLNTSQRAPRRWQPEEVAFVEALAGRAWAEVERAKAEAALRESDVRFRSIANLVPDLLWSSRPDGYTEWYNQRWCEYTGQTLEQAIGWGWTDAIHPDDREGSARRYAEAVASGRMLVQEHRIRRRDGEYRWFLVRAEPVRDAAGRLTTFGSATDIHARRTMMEALRESEERQAFLLKLSDALRPLADPMAVQAAASRVLGEHLGADRSYYVEIDEARGECRVRRDYLRGDSPSMAAVYRIADYGWSLPVMRAGRTVVFEDVARSDLVPDAARPALTRIQIVAHIAVPVVKAGVLVGCVCVTEPVPRAWTAAEVDLVRETAERTWAAVERAKAEAELRDREADLARVQRIGRVGGLDIDIAGGLRSRRSPEYLRLHGLPEAAAEETHADWLARVHPDDREGAERTLLAALHSDASAYESEYRIVRPDDGEVRWIQVRADIERTDAGVPMRLVGAHVDVTDQKRMQEALGRSEERLRLALAAARMGTWRWEVDADSHERDANLNRLLGHPAEPSAGPLDDFLACIHPADRGRVADAFHASIRNGRNLSLEFRVSRPDGAVRWLRDQGDVFGGPEGRYLAGACVDVTDLKEAEAALRHANDALELRVAERTADLGAEIERRKDLTRRLSTAQEDERRRVSRDLHDSIGQLLAGLSMAFKAVEASEELPPFTAGKMTEAKAIVESLGKEAHGLAVRLRPTSLDDIGLEPALGQLVAEWSASAGVRTDFHLEGPGPGRLAPEIETALYRVVQEALTNVGKHAGASLVSVVVSRRDGYVMAVIEDDGTGFDPQASPKGRLGLLGMRERVELVGGEIEVESEPGAGTTVYARIPIPWGEGGGM